MRIAMMGSGGLGGYVGAKLAASGHNVTFIARRRHLDAMRQGGLSLTSDLGNIRLPTLDATDDPEGRDPLDLVIFAAKGHDTAEAAELITPLVGRETSQTKLTWERSVKGRGDPRPIRSSDGEHIT